MFVVLVCALLTSCSCREEAQKEPLPDSDSVTMGLMAKFGKFQLHKSDL